MADPHNIIDRFHRSLYNVIVDKFNDRQEALVNGAAATFDAYKEQVGYLQALRDVIEWADAVEADQYGPMPGQKKEGEQ